MTEKLRIDDPYTLETIYEEPLATWEDVERAMETAHAAHLAFKTVPLADRIAVVNRFIDAFAARRDTFAAEVAQQMGKPVKQAQGEIDTMFDRCRTMCRLAEAGLAPEVLPDKSGFERWIAREPVGVVVVLAAWNYPYIIAINPVVAAVLAGNSVILKHSSRTAQCAHHIASCFDAAQGPDGLVTALTASHAITERAVQHSRVGYVSFTGSVFGGRRIYQAVAQSKFVDVGLELGGKDPAYVTANCDFDKTVDSVLDGAFYNAGQSCCGVERVYVEAPLYERFVDAAVALAEGYVLGNPKDDATTMGPMAQPNAPGALQGHVDDARNLGGRVLTGGGPIQVEGRGRFFAPTVVANTDHRMAIAKEESFGPVVAIQSVKNDEEALSLMNDSDLGLTASVWCQDIDRAKALLTQVEAGTVFLNRCDYLDPALAWTGWKDSGKGVSLSKFGFHAVTRPKSYHLRTRFE